MWGCHSGIDEGNDTCPHKSKICHTRTPYTMALPNKFSVTFEPAIGLIRNLNKQGYQGDYQFLINLNRPIIGEVVTAVLEV